MPKQFRMDKLELPNVLAMAPKMRSKVLRQGARVVAVRTRDIVPVRSGRLRKAITYSVSRGGIEAKIRAPKAPHAHLVHDGTRRHTIHAKSRQSARAGWRFYHGSVATKVKHPGARQNQFFVKAGEDSRGDMERVMRDTAREVIAEVAAGR